MLTNARKMAIGVGEAGLKGDIGGAITKVTATAENNFSEAVFEKLILDSLVILFN